MMPAPAITPEQQQEIIRQIKSELDVIKEQVPGIQSMQERLKRALDDMADPEMPPMQAIQSAVGALVFCQSEQFKTVVRELARKATQLEATLARFEGQVPLVHGAGLIPPMNVGRGRFGR